MEPLIQFDKRQAQILGSAYLSMLSRYNYNLNKALDQALAAIEAAEGSQPLAKKSLLNAAHHEFRELQEKKPGYRYLATFKQWLEAIDQELQDFRGFTPTVKIRFAKTPAFPCSLDFVQKRLPLPDDYDGDVLVYNGPRDAYLKDKPDPIDVQVLTPFDRETLAGIRGEEDLRRCYRATISNHRNASTPELDAAVKFAQRSGLVPRVRLAGANTEKEGTLVW